jgi:predicted metal-dependent phosphoesterase TrpH
LEKELCRIRKGREIRGKAILHSLESKFGIRIKWELVKEIAGEAAIGRPHIAHALVQMGHVGSFKEAFNRYLNNDGPCYVAGVKLLPADCVKLIHSCGGSLLLSESTYSLSNQC